MYYLIGNCIFLFGDFSKLTGLRTMYNHCNTTEDKDMTAFDFVTDHLVDIDCIFDSHENDEQKPHSPLAQDFSNITHQVIHEYLPFKVNPTFLFILIVKPLSAYHINYSFQAITSIFHPPATV